ncbi:hypothetical protein ABRQ22_15515 [Cellulosimicrobium sp. ES-005]|uniref:DUF998 domain-containing protein n=1 Tax=Cellulosimicrobium sp. ES-005 TaxID=3163031 RepID=A0AAU8FYK7_9MICO
MKSFVWGVTGSALGILIVVVVGVMSAQAVGLEGGAVLSLNNEVVGVTSPRLPILQFAAIASSCALIAYALTLGVAGRPREQRHLFLSGFCIAVGALIALGVYFAAARDEAAGGISVGFASGWQGWIEEGAMNSAVHLLLVLSLGTLALSLYQTLRGQVRRHEQEDPTRMNSALPDGQRHL